MSTINFQQIWGYAQAQVACNKCGRISKRRVREYCTVNPYNRNADGMIKSPSEVRADAQKHADDEARRQVDKGRICRPCSTGEQP